MTERPHGYVRFKVEACRCPICRAGNAAYVARRHRLIAYGRWQPYIDAEPARAHVRSLMAAGLGWKRVALLADVPTGAMSKLLYGCTERGPSKRVRPATAAAILAVELENAPVAGGVLINAAGTKRRIRALAAIGWSVSAQAVRIGRTPSNYWKILGADQITAATARAVEDLYSELWDTPAPDGYSATRARNWARSNRCFPPAAWDDETINDPDALPAVLPRVDGSDSTIDEMRIQEFAAGFDVALTRQESAEVARRMAGSRRDSEIGALLGVGRSSVYWMRQRKVKRSEQIAGEAFETANEKVAV